MGKYILAVGLAIVLVAGAGYGGYRLGVHDGRQEASAIQENFFAQRSANGQTGAQNRQGNLTPRAQGTFTPGQGFSGSFGGRGGTAGTIKEIQGNTIIVSTTDSEVQVEVGTDTRITMTADGSISDLKVGERIFVSGQTNGNTVTANQIQVVPDMPTTAQ